MWHLPVARELPPQRRRTTAVPGMRIVRAFAYYNDMEIGVHACVNVDVARSAVYGRHCRCRCCCCRSVLTLDAPVLLLSLPFSLEHIACIMEGGRVRCTRLYACWACFLMIGRYCQAAGYNISPDR